MKEIYRRMPNGETTSFIKEYFKAWKDLYNPIENAFNIRIHSFDPDLHFMSPEYGFVAIPVPFAYKLVSILQRKNPDDNIQREGQ